MLSLSNVRSDESFSSRSLFSQIRRRAALPLGWCSLTALLTTVGSAHITQADDCKDCGVGAPVVAKSSATLECKDCGVSMKALDLSHVPSEKELRQAGQLGGALSPTGFADAGIFAQRVDESLRNKGVIGGLAAKTTSIDKLEELVTSKAKVERARQINLSFGEAIQEWNRHHYRKAADMFAEHVEKYPDSPWAAEALLHMGCDSKYSGRFSEAAEYYDTILRYSSDNPKEDSWEVHQKAKLRWADLDISEGKFSDAQSKLSNILNSEKDWRRRTWAMHWIQQMASYRANARQLRACGTRALADVLTQTGETKKALRVASILPSDKRGFSLGELQRLANKQGIPMRGFRSQVHDLKNLPLPLIIHYDFRRTPGTSVVPPLKKLVSFGEFQLKAKQTAAIAKRRNSESPFRLEPNNSSGTSDAGHFLVVRSIDEHRKVVNIYDPQERRPYKLSFTQLAREWSGTGLTMVAKKEANQPEPRRVAWLSPYQMRRVIGGCCGVPRSQENLGDPGGNDDPCAKGTPIWSVNKVTLNLHVKDIPLWYDTPVGPSVYLRLAYNSQDATNQNSVFGNKWVFNYGSYLVVDTGAGGGVVTIFMPDGRQDVFVPNGSGGFIPPVGVYNTLDHLSTNRWRLTLPSGEQFIYDIPAGTTSLQPFLVEQYDPWGQKLTFGYNTDVKLTTITDALGRNTNFVYSNGHVTRVEDPFGRRVFFTYDTNGNLTKAIDMEGNAFGYSYDSSVRLTQIATIQGNYTFYHEGPDGQISGNYPYPGAAMWQNVRLTVTNPLGENQEYFYDGVSGGKTWVIRKAQYIPYTSTSSNNSYNTSKVVYNIGANIGGKGYITGVTTPRVDSYTTGISYNPSTGRVEQMRDTRGKIYTVTTSSKGLPQSITDPNGHTRTVTYAANGIDALNAIDNAGRKTWAKTYNAYHQPLTVTVDPDNLQGLRATTTMTYKPWGAIESSTSPEGIVTNYNYHATSKLLLNIVRGGITIATFTYDGLDRLRTVTNATNLTTTYEYNMISQPNKINYPDGTFTFVDYACCGLISRYLDRDGRWTYLDYDKLKRLKRVQDGAGRVTRFDYDANGNRTRMIDSKGQITRWAYDNSDRLVTVIQDDGSYKRFSYDIPNNIINVQDSRGASASYTYDATNHLSSAVRNGTGENYARTYNNLDQLASSTDNIGTTNYTYDLLGRIKTVDGPWANDTLNYNYDTFGRMSSTNISGANGLTYGYDSLSRPKTITTSLGTWTYDYEGDSGVIQKLTRPNGSYTQFGYDGLKRLNSIVDRKSDNSLIASHTYVIDNTKGVRSGATRQFGTNLGINLSQSVAYTYDIKTNELKGEVSNEGTPIINNTFTYDNSGNRSQSTTGNSGSVTTSAYTVNRLNQVTTVTTTPPAGLSTTFAYTYDASGNLRRITNNRDSTSTTLYYDTGNRIIRVESQDSTGVNSNAVAFTYDLFGRKAIISLYSWNTGTSQWVLQSEKRRIFRGNDVVQERDGTGAVTANLVRDGGVGGILARTTSSTTNYYHYDLVGNVTALTNGVATTTAQYRYGGFGNIIQSAGSEVPNNPYTFATRESYSIAGAYDMGARLYQPGIGRFINRDPSGMLDGMNLYAYVGNNPISSVDVNGRWAFDGNHIEIGPSDYPWLDFKAMDLGEGTVAALDGFNPFGDPFKDNGYYDPCDKLLQASHFLGNVSRDALVTAATSGLGSGAGAAGKADDILAVGDDILGGGGCFTAGTPVVMADGRVKAIEKVKKEDLVLSRNEKTKQTVKSRVTQVSVRWVSATLDIKLDNGEVIHTTSEHPFYVKGKGFIPAGEIELGSSIITRAGPSRKLISSHIRKQRTRVYNFTVDRTHTYFIGKGNSALWVHNNLGCEEIALGVKEHLAEFSEQVGAPSYGNWGISMEAVTMKEIAQEIDWTMDAAKRIHFNVQGMDLNKLFTEAGKALPEKNFHAPGTSYEFARIANNAKLYAKTTFYDGADRIVWQGY